MLRSTWQLLLGEEEQDLLQEPRIIPAITYFCKYALFCATAFGFVPVVFNSLELFRVFDKETPIWDLPSDITLKISHGYQLTIWNESNRKKIENIQFSVSQPYLALWDEQIVYPVSTSLMWVMEDIYDIIINQFDMKLDTAFIDPFSRSVEYLPGTIVETLPLRENSIVRLRWGDRFMKKDNTARAIIKEVHPSNMTLQEYAYKVKFGNGSTAMLSSTQILYPQYNFQFLSDHDYASFAQDLAGELCYDCGLDLLRNGAILVFGESQITVMHGFSFIHKTYEYLELGTREGFKSKIRRSLAEERLMYYKPFGMAMQLSCEDSGFINSPNICSAWLMRCNKKVLSSNIKKYKRKFNFTIGIALFVYSLGVIAIRHFIVLSLWLAPITFILVNLLRHVETEMTEYKGCLLLLNKLYVPYMILDSTLFLLHELPFIESQYWRSKLESVPTIRDSPIWTFILIAVTVLRIIDCRYKENKKQFLANVKLRRHEREIQRIQESMSESDRFVEPKCRICFCGAEEGRLISPCKCRGSIRFVHLRCLNHWRKSSINTHAYFQCDQCSYKYSFQRTILANVVRSSLVLNAISAAIFLIGIASNAYLVSLLDYIGIFPSNEILLSLLEVEDEFNFGKRNLINGSDPVLQLLFDQRGQSRVLKVLGLTVSNIFFGFFSFGILGFCILGYGLEGVILFGMERRRGRAAADTTSLILVAILGLVRVHFALYEYLKRSSGAMLQNVEERILEVGESYEAVCKETIISSVVDDEDLLPQLEH